MVIQAFKCCPEKLVEQIEQASGAPEGSLNSSWAATKSSADTSLVSSIENYSI